MEEVVLLRLRVMELEKLISVAALLLGENGSADMDNIQEAISLLSAVNLRTE